MIHKSYIKKIQALLYLKLKNALGSRSKSGIELNRYESPVVLAGLTVKTVSTKRSFANQTIRVIIQQVRYLVGLIISSKCNES